MYSASVTYSSLLLPKFCVYLPVSSDFVESLYPEISIFFDQTFTSGAILNETSKTIHVKIY